MAVRSVPVFRHTALVRKPVDKSATALMVLLCLVWGFQQVAIKAAAADVPPLFQVALRSGISAALVWLFSRFVLRDRWLSGVRVRSGIAVGVLFAAEFLLMGEGLRWTSAAHMAVFVYTGPMFAALGLHIAVPDERLDWPQWAGIGLAFAGVAVIFLGPSGGATLPNWLLGDTMALCAGAAWGLTTVGVRISRLNDAPAAQTLFHQLVWGFVLLIPVAIATGEDSFRGTLLAWSSLGYQAVLVSFASYLAWFWLLRRYLAARLGVLSFMSPLFGVAMGALLLDERLDASFVAGSTLVILGLLVVSAHGPLLELLTRRPRLRRNRAPETL